MLGKREREHPPLKKTNEALLLAKVKSTKVLKDRLISTWVIWVELFYTCE
jgi:hypothetical protein